MIKLKNFRLKLSLKEIISTGNFTIVKFLILLFQGLINSFCHHFSPFFIRMDLIRKQLGHSVHCCVKIDDRQVIFLGNLLYHRNDLFRDDIIVDIITGLIGFRRITKINLRLSWQRFESIDHCLQIFREVGLIFPVE